MASVKVWKEYALEIGIKEEVWDAGVNKSVDKYYGSKYDEKLTEGCHTFLEKTIPKNLDSLEKIKVVTTDGKLKKALKEIIQEYLELVKYSLTKIKLNANKQIPIFTGTEDTPVENTIKLPDGFYKENK